MLTALMLLAAAGHSGSCARPVAPDQASARRIAQTIIVNRNRTGHPLPPYDLRIAPDREDAGQWLAYQTPRNGPTRGGGGMSFRIDRCSGAVTRITYAR